MAKVYPGPTLTPAFRDFLPGWVATQPWYTGEGRPALVQVGLFRLEDPDGEVGIETHLVTDGQATYQIPMTYRGAPLAGAAPQALIAQAEHSVLGPRWIYDAVVDPAWVGELLRLVETEGCSDASSNGGARETHLRGKRLRPGDLGAASIELIRVLTTDPVDEPEAIGVVLGRWQPPTGEPVDGCLAVLRAR